MDWTGFQFMDWLSIHWCLKLKNKIPYCRTLPCEQIITFFFNRLMSYYYDALKCISPWATASKSDFRSTPFGTK